MRGPVISVGIFGLIAASAAVLIVVALARDERRDPARCPPALVAQGPRCCAPGQRWVQGACSGVPKSCPPGMELIRDPAGCAMKMQRAKIAAGRLKLGASDWEGVGVEEPRAAPVAAFEIDVAEVSYDRWKGCVAAATCRPLPNGEPGRPVTGVTPEEAEQMCLLSGGRLPTADEWLMAASGTEPRRFPWGQTGLVCRRASFGLVDGPCSEGATGPELSGARPDGATPEGVMDLSGNVAEWAREPDGKYRARGGSYLSREAGELKSWAVEPMPAAQSARHIGFRCAYDAR